MSQREISRDAGAEQSKRPGRIRPLTGFLKPLLKEARALWMAQVAGAFTATPTQ